MINLDFQSGNYIDFTILQTKEYTDFKTERKYPAKKIQPAIENYLGKLTLLHWNHSVVYDLVLTTKECQPAGWDESFFVFKTLETHGIHRGFTLPRRSRDCYKIEKKQFSWFTYSLFGEYRAYDTCITPISSRILSERCLFLT